MSILEKIPSRKEVIEKFKGAGGQIAAVYPYHYHRALFRAFDILPVEVWGPPGVDTTYGSAYLQPYVCSVVHSGLSFYSMGNLDVVDYLVVPHTCDSLQGLGSVYIDFIKPKQPVFTIYIPRGRKDLDIEFLSNEFRHIYNQLTEFTGKKPSDERILEEIKKEEQANKIVAELYENRENLNLSDYEFYRVIRSREFMPVEDFTKLGEEGLNEYKGGNPVEGAPVIFSGLLPEPMSLLEELEEIGGKIVGDDFACCGRRVYPPGKSGDPFIRMAESILNAGPDSSRGATVNERAEHLKNLAKKYGAKGVVFYIVKFCEMELFYIPHLMRELKEAGFGAVYIEVDINEPLPDQTLTRLEAFLEVL